MLKLMFNLMLNRKVWQDKINDDVKVRCLKES